MKSKDLSEISTIELNEKLGELKAELFNLRFQHAINQLDNPLRIKAVRKDIARVKTFLRQREVSEGGQLQKGGN